jgi:type IV pilus assembly protein PilO
MTNFSGLSRRAVGREQVLLWLPAAVGGLGALLLGFGLVLPAWQRLQVAQQELEQLEEQRQRLPLLRAQLEKLARDQEQAEQQRNAILGLIAGSGEISTFLAQLSDEAQATGVQLDGYEPVTIAASEPSKGKPAQTPQPPPDPLLAPGLQKTSVLLTARGTGPQLLAFLRRLEALSLLVVQSDLQLSHEASKQKEGAALPTSLRVQLSLYSREPIPNH